jgi:hypothetical protein
MATGAVKVQGLFQRHHLVLDAGVAELALYVVFRDMDRVEKGRAVEGFQPLGKIVARPAALLLCGAVPLDHVGVALRTGHLVTNDLLVVDEHAFILQIRRAGMTTQASSQGLAYRPVLEVAEITGGGCDRQVLSLDDLRMA